MFRAVEAPKERLPAWVTRLDTEYVQFTFHHTLLEDMYFMSREWSCYYKIKIHMLQGLVLASLQGCALKSRADVKQ